MRSVQSNFSAGFTLLELLVVIAIIAILAAVVLLILNPLELLARGRDAARLSDMENMQKAINLVLQDAGNAQTTLCKNVVPPNCTGNSNDSGANVRKVDGSGWIKVNFGAANTISLSTLP